MFISKKRWTPIVLFILFFGLPQMILARDIVIGSINDNPKEEVQIFLPIAKYLGEELHKDGIEKGKVVITRSMENMAELLSAGKVDLYIDSPYPILNVSSLSGGVFFLRRWKGGLSGYHSVIFTHKDSTITTLEDLKGKMIAFEEPWSSSSYFLPKHSLMQHNISLVEKNNFKESVEGEKLGYVFSYSDKNTMFWTLNKQVDAGAMSQEKMHRHAKGKMDSFRIIHKTFQIPRHVVLHRADLEPELVVRITEILTEMDTTEKGREVLKAFESTTKFDEIPEDSLNALQDGLKFMREKVGE